MFINIIHLFLVAPLLIYVGFIGNQMALRHSERNNKIAFNIQMGVGVIVALYHSYLIYSKMSNGY